MVQTVTCEPVSLIKVLLHAAKYPACAVNGVFLGTIDGDEVRIADVVPLFHNSINLAMQLEVALAMVRLQACAWHGVVFDN